MMGYQESEIGDKPAEWFDRIHDADRERVTQEIAAHQAGSVPQFESEHRVLHKGGTFRWMLSRGLAVRNGSGKSARRVGWHTNITAGKVSAPPTGVPSRLPFNDAAGRA